MEKSIKTIDYNGNHIHYRWVWVEELGEEVRVGVYEEYNEFFSNDTEIDDMFSCYVDRETFEKLNDKALAEYVEQEFYS